MSNLTCDLIDSMTKCVLKDGFKAVFWKIRKTCRNISMMEFTVREVTVFRFATCLNEAPHQIKFVNNLRNVQHN